MKTWILASASPRRKELLEKLLCSFAIIPSTKEEVITKKEPAEVVKELSYQKAVDIAEKQEHTANVIGADTIVVCGREIFGKPKDRQDAIRMLKLLSGHTHQVYTGVTVAITTNDTIETHTFYEKTDVTMHEMSDEEIEAYVETKEPFDKAGAYAMQGRCAIYFEKINGDYNNVLGLPIARLYQEMKKIGVDLLTRTKAVVFDLDGTLADSIVSISYCANRALAKYGLQTFPDEKYKYFVGDGVAELVKRTLREAGDVELTHFDEVKTEYEALFATDCMYQVKPYEGIIELIKELKKKNIKTAVLSNKPHERTVEVIDSLFGEGVFDVVQGQTESISKKPSPYGVYEIGRRLSITPKEMLYIGDTDTDMQTGKASGAYTIGVLWGFRDRQELMAHHADAIISNPKEILEYL